MELRMLKELPKNDIFRMSYNGKELMKVGYDRSSKKYECVYCDDINHVRYINGTRLVVTLTDREGGV